MNAEMVSGGTQVLGLVLIAIAAAAAFGALAARSLFAMCVGLAGVGALAACALVALGRDEAALAMALLGVGLAPVFLLAGLLLSARGFKARALPWISLIVASASVVLIAWISPELSSAPPAAAEAPSASAFWLAALVFVAVCTCAGLIGYGERGVLEHKRGGTP